MNIQVLLALSSTASPRGHERGYYPLQNPSVSDCDSRLYNWDLTFSVLEIGCFNCVTPLISLSQVLTILIKYVASITVNYLIFVSRSPTKNILKSDELDRLVFKRHF